jgi:hypothetical protein
VAASRLIGNLAPVFALFHQTLNNKKSICKQGKLQKRKIPSKIIFVLSRKKSLFKKINPLKMIFLVKKVDIAKNCWENYRR